MKKITSLLFLAIFPALISAQSYTTPGTGVEYTLEDIMNLSPSTVSFDGTNYTLSENLEIAEQDTLLLNNALSLLMNQDVIIDVRGTFISDAQDQEITINATDSLTPYEGFWFYDTSEVLINNTTIKNGGGLKVITPDFTLTNSFLAYNVPGVSTGSAVSLSNGSPLIDGNTFLENQMPAISSGANQNVSATISNNYLEGNGQLNGNRPQINMGVTGADTLRIINNTIIGDPDMTQVGGIAVANLIGGEIRAIIDNNIIRNNRYGMTVAGGNAFAYIRGNVIEDNNTQNNPNLGGSGISLNAGSDTQNIIASNNEFRGNLWGITVIGEATINLGDGTDNPGGNIFSNNGNNGVTYALYNNTDNTIIAMNNCWIEGQENTLEDAESVIFHQVDDSSLGLVTFDPVGCQELSVENPSLSEFNFYPNPAKNEIRFNNAPGFEKVEVYDLTGKLINQHAVSSNNNQLLINLSSGIYILKFTGENMNISKKLIVE